MFDKQSLIWVAVLLLIVVVALGVFMALRRKRRAVFGGADKHLMMPAGNPKHTHLTEFTGISTEDEGHRHVVSEGKDVGVTKGKASHVHDITECVVSK